MISLSLCLFLKEGIGSCGNIGSVERTDVRTRHERLSERGGGGTGRGGQGCSNGDGGHSGGDGSADNDADNETNVHSGGAARSRDAFTGRSGSFQNAAAAGDTLGGLGAGGLGRLGGGACSGAHSLAHSGRESGSDAALGVLANAIVKVGGKTPSLSLSLGSFLVLGVANGRAMSTSLLRREK